MIYVDDTFTYPGKGDWCHMWTDGDVSELDAFAASIGLRRSWRHDSRGVTGLFPHYDLRPSKRALALNHGAVYMPLSEWIRPRLAARKDGDDE